MYYHVGQPKSVVVYRLYAQNTLEGVYLRDKGEGRDYLLFPDQNIVIL